MTGRNQSCDCGHWYMQHMAGGCTRCACTRFSRARAPMPSTYKGGVMKPLQKPKRGPLLDRDGQ